MRHQQPNGSEIQREKKVTLSNNEKEKSTKIVTKMRGIQQIQQEARKKGRIVKCRAAMWKGNEI